MGTLRGSKYHVCSVYWDKDEGKWILCDKKSNRFYPEDYYEDEFYELEATQDAPIDDVVKEVLETTYLNPSEITVYDPNHDGIGFCARRTYNRRGMWTDEGESYSEFVETGKSK